MPRFLPSLIVVFGAALAATWLLFVGFARLTGSDINPLRPELGSLAPERLFDVTRAAATAAGLLAGVFAIVYAYRKQRVQEAAGKREDSQQLAKRYQDAAEQLGHSQAAVRLAGIYAMSRLADDWVDQRQQCVDVLCAYLRLPAALEDHDRESVIRRTIVDEILTHTTTGRSDGRAWTDLRLDLSRAHLESMAANDQTFSNLILDGADLRGDIDFSGSRLTGILSMRDAHVRGSLSFAFVGREGRVQSWGTRVYEGGSLRMDVSVESAARNDFAQFTFAYSIVDEGADFVLTLSPGSMKRSFDLGGSEISGRLAIYGTGQECDPGAVVLRDVSTHGTGEIGLQKELLGASGIVSPHPRLLESKIMMFEVGEWTVVEDD